MSKQHEDVNAVGILQAMRDLHNDRCHRRGAGPVDDTTWALMTAHVQDDDDDYLDAKFVYGLAHDQYLAGYGTGYDEGYDDGRDE
jgi:hypothetical protein